MTPLQYIPYNIIGRSFATTHTPISDHSGSGVYGHRRQYARFSNMAISFRLAL